MQNPNKRSHPERGAVAHWSESSSPKYWDPNMLIRERTFFNTDCEFYRGLLVFTCQASVAWPVGSVFAHASRSMQMQICTWRATADRIGPYRSGPAPRARRGPPRSGRIKIPKISSLCMSFSFQCISFNARLGSAGSKLRDETKTKTPADTYSGIC